MVKSTVSIVLYFIKLQEGWKPVSRWQCLKTFPFSTKYHADLCGFDLNFAKIYKPLLKICDNILTKISENCYFIIT